MAEVTFAESALPKQADVVIVGAGLAGLFSAHYIERAGLGRVLVLERRDAVASLTSAHSAEGFRLEWDAAENIEMVRASVEVFDNFAEVVGVSDYQLDVRKNGYLFVSGGLLGPSYRNAGLRERVEHWRGLGLYWRPRPEGLFVGWEHALLWDETPVEALDPVPADVAYLDQVRIHGRRLTRFWKDLRFDNLHWHAGQYVNVLPYDGRPVIGE